MPSPKTSNDRVHNNFRSAFTLLELLIVISILTIIASGALWVSMDVYSGYLFRNEETLFVALLYRTRDEAIITGIPSGLNVGSTTYAIFSGNQFNPQNSLNQVFSRNPGVSVHGPQTAVFQENAELVPGQEVFLLSYGNHQKTITINPDGGIVY